MKKRGSLSGIGEATRAALSGLSGRGESLAPLLEIRTRWKEIVGDALCQQLVPLGLREGTLDVGAFSSTWMNEARFFEKTLLEKLRSITGLGIEKIRFRLVTKRGSLDGASEGPSRAKTVEKRSLDERELARIEDAVRQCDDDALKERLKNLFRLVSQRDMHHGQK